MNHSTESCATRLARMIVFAIALMTTMTANVQASAPASAVLPDGSIFVHDALLTDQNGRAFRLVDRRGKPQIVSMFYTSCRYVCPLIIDSASAVVHELDAAEQERLGVLLISMDPDRDTPSVLARVFAQRKLDAPSWTFARTGARDVRSIAALLGVRYRELENGEFNHTSALVLLDPEGRIVMTTTVLGTEPDPEFVAAVRRTIGSWPPGTAHP